MGALHQAYYDAASAHDAAAVAATLAPGIRFHSPTKLKPFEGHGVVARLFPHLFEVLEGFRFTDVTVSDSAATLHFDCRIGGRDAQGVDILHFDGDGLIDDFRVMIRPLSALQALNEAMGARLAAQAAA